jgi:hypothetical protein
MDRKGQDLTHEGFGGGHLPSHAAGVVLKCRFVEDKVPIVHTGLHPCPSSWLPSSSRVMRASGVSRTVSRL